MILLFATALVAVRTKNLLVLLLFFAITQLVWATLVYNTPKGIGEDYGVMVTVDLCVGLLLFFFTHAYLAQKSPDTIQRVTRRLNRWLCIGLGASLTIAAVIIYKAVVQ